MLIFVMTENGVEKARFYHDISQCEKIVCELEENVLQINKEGIVEDTDMGQNMSISGPIRIIQWDEKQYVWFYTSSLLSGESTGYFHQIDISQQNKDTIYEVNAVLFAAGSCWEGVDFPGDMVSSLIIVKLPFAVPDPISEAQKKEYDCLKDYIQAVVVPDMQKKLRQGFGRALRTETDTCVVSILDERAGEEGRYHEEVMCALPKCKMTKDIKDVQRFIRNRKGVEYYL